MPIPTPISARVPELDPHRHRAATPRAHQTARGLSQAWHREREQRLHLICKAIAARVQNAGHARPAIRKAAKRWHGRAFRCDAARKWRLSANTVTALYYRWRRNPSPDAFKLRFGQTRRALPSALVAHALRYVLADRGCTFAQAIKALRSACEHGHQIPGFGRLIEYRKSHGLPQSQPGRARFPWHNATLYRALTTRERVALTALTGARAVISKLEAALAIERKTMVKQESALVAAISRRTREGQPS